jgi:hypothetical protein
MKIRRYVCLAVSCVLLNTCGGGDSGGDEGGPPPAAPSAPAQPTGHSSYRNFKLVGLLPQALPNATLGPHAHADFNGDGRVDLFAAEITYWPPTTPAAATPSNFNFWIKQSDDSYAPSASFPTLSGCIHPRKALIADFNQDGKPDVFVACHGFDAAPFPGEKNKVVLSQPGGGYAVSDASSDVGFFHSAASADLDGDDDADVIVTNHFDANSAFVLLNDGNGNFTREAAARLPALGQRNYFTVELLDVDGDNALDLFLGGHEWESAPTLVYLNPGTNVFASAAAITIPPVINEGVVLDVVATGTGAGRSLWILRTSGGDGSFYSSRVVQKVTLATLASSVPLNQRPANWIPWIIPTTVGGQPVIASDNTNHGMAPIPQ